MAMQQPHHHIYTQHGVGISVIAILYIKMCTEHFGASLQNSLLLYIDSDQFNIAAVHTFKNQSAYYNLIIIIIIIISLCSIMLI